MMSLWDALRMNMMISYQELVRTFPNTREHSRDRDQKEAATTKPLKEAFLLLAFTFNRINRQFREH